MTKIANENEQSDGLIKFLENKNRKPIKRKVNEDQKTYALIYPRVSGIEQKSGYSLENQKKACEEFAKRMNYEILAYFGCTNESAKTDDRVEFKKMLEFARKCKKKIIIITYAIDRFSRSGENAIDILNQLFEEGIYLQSASNPQEPGTLRGLIQTEKELLEAKHDNQKRFLLCKGGLETKLLEGGWQGKVPYGYYREYPKGSRRREIYVDKKKAKIIRNIFNWYAYEKLSYDKIAMRLHTVGIEFSRYKVQYILKNPFYAGLISHGFLKGKIVKSRHEPIISPELFGIVNGYMSMNRSGFTQKIENNNLPLKGFCKCGLCGYGLTGFEFENSGHRYSYYKCRKNCSGGNINALYLHEMFLEKLKAYEINPVLFSLLKKQVIATFLDLSEKEFDNEKVLRTYLTEAKKKLHTLKENLGQGIVPSEVYRELEPDYVQKIYQIEQELTKISHDSSNLVNQVQIAIETASNLLNFWKLLDYRGRRQLQSLVFPQGIQYDKENKTVLTTAINPVFSEMTRIAQELENKQIQENSGIPLNTFRSSNFLWDGLGKIIECAEMLKYSLPDVWEANKLEQVDPFTGTTKSVEYKYTSDSTGFILSGTPITYVGLIYENIEMTLTGKEYSGSTIFCSANAPYMFTGLNEGMYTLATSWEYDTNKYADMKSLIITGNTSYNPSLNPTR